MRTRSVVALTIAAGTFAAFALVLPAVANTSGTTYQVCANKSNGSLRLLTAGRQCTRAERLVTFGATGPAGPRGAAGARGLQGEPGPSNGYASLSDTEPVVAGADDSPNAAVVDPLTLPSGNYIVSFTGQALTITSNAFISCRLWQSDPLVADGWAHSFGTITLDFPHSAYRRSVVFSGPLRLQQGAQVVVRCNNQAGTEGAVTIESATLNVIKVGDLETVRRTG